MATSLTASDLDVYVARPVELLRVNVGCGRSPTPGWVNFDNSLSVRAASHPLLLRIALASGLLNAKQGEFARDAARSGVRWADAVRRIPLSNGAAEIIYSSHMLEHLHRTEAVAFLSEARRVLAPGGVLRIVVPDIAKLVANYVRDGDADALVSATLLTRERPRGLFASVRALVVGAREHAWMYDGPSLCRFLVENGFTEPTVLAVGQTTIAEPGALDLAERESESVYVEARRP